MRVVTARYCARRRRSAYSLLPWHFRNEVANNGYLDLRPCYDSRPFRISRWINPDGVGFGFYDDVKAMRYSELDDPVCGSWESRFDPWEVKRRPMVGNPVFHFPETNEHYVSSTLDRIIDNEIKYDHIKVVYPPYGGCPLVCVERGGKVTIL